LLRAAKAGSPAGGKEPGATIAGTGRLSQRSLSQKAVGAALSDRMAKKRIRYGGMYKFLFDLTDGGNWLVDVHASS
jgi:hypothetical protein